MAVDFPNSPSTGQVFSVGALSWRWTGYAWARIPDPGAKGEKGEVGPQGIQGTQGNVGDKGIQGDRGGLKYTFSTTTTTNADPGVGKLRYNSSTVSSVSQIAIDAANTDNIDVSDFIASFNNSSSSLKGHVLIKSNSNADNTHTIFEITGVTDNSGYLQINVQNGIGNIPSNDEVITVQLLRLGDKGEKGAPSTVSGDKGNQGEKAGIVYQFSNATIMSDPGIGKFRYNNSALSSVTAIAIDLADINSNDLSNFISTWDDSNSNVDGTLEIKSNDNSDTTLTIFQVTAVTSNSGWFQLTVQNGTGVIPSDLETCVINFARYGDKGTKGEVGPQGLGGVSFEYKFNGTTTSDADPGTGKIILNQTNVASVTQMFIDDLEGGSTNTNIETYLRTIDDSNSTVKGHLRITNKFDANDFVLFAISGASVEASGYHKIALTHVTGDCAGANIFSNNEDLVLTFARTGDKGQKGELNTYGISAANGDNTNEEKIRLTDSIGNTDDVVLGASTGLSIARVGDKITFTNTVTDSGNTTYTLPDTGTDGTNFTDARGSATITLTGSDSTTDPVVITAGTNVKITDTGSGGFTINAQDTNDNTQLTTEEVQDIVGAMFSSNTETRISATYQDTDGTIDLVVDDMTANTTYTLPDTGTDGTNFTNARGSATITLTGSDSTTDAVVITAGDNVKITDTGSGGFTINALDTNDNTQLTTEEIQDIIGAMVAGNTETRIAVTYNDTSGKLNFVVDDQSSDNNTTYDLLAVQTGGNNTDPAIKLDASSGDDDEVKLVGVSHSGITVTRADDSTINFNTSLQLLARQSTNGSNADPNLDLMGSATVALDTVKLVGGTNVNIERNSSGNEITFTSQNDNTQLSTEQVQDIVGAMFSSNTETRISATYQDGDGTIDLVVDDMTATGDNTTYDLVTSTSGSNIKLKLDASTGTSDDDEITITAGTNITLTDDSSGGFTIASSATLSGTIDQSDKVKVNTSTENEYHNIAFVPKDTTTGSYQTLEIDSTDQRLAWNPSNNRLQSYDTQTYRLITWSGGSSGTAGQVLTSGGTGGWTWSTISAGPPGPAGPPGADSTVPGPEGPQGPAGPPGPSTTGTSDMEIFTQSGTWTKPSSGNMVNVYIWGGGAGGRNGSTARGGGGGGGYGEYRIPMSSLGSSVTVTIGGGGGQNTNGGVSTFGSSAYQAGGGTTGDQGGQHSGTRGGGGTGGSPLGTGTGGAGGNYTTSFTDDSTYYHNSGAPGQTDGHSGGGGGSAAGGGISNGASAHMAGGGGGAYRQSSGNSSGGTSYGGGNGGNGGSNGTAPGGGGGANGSGARGECWVVVV